MKPDLREQLTRRAKEARANAYAPYSGYAVGAALMAESGAVFGGANVENAAYPTGLCAERVALFAAVASGERRFTALVVMTRDGGSPCGSCRQALAEFGLDIEVAIVDESGRVCVETTVAGLLPHAFGPSNLGKS
jgi:cytidine deaminase